MEVQNLYSQAEKFSVRKTAWKGAQALQNE